MVVVIRRGVRSNPERLQREMEELFQALMPTRSRWALHAPSCSRPVIEVYETDQSLVIHAELAGIDESSLNVMAGTGVVTIEANRPFPVQAGNRRYRETGITYGPLKADVFLPFDIELEHASAEFVSGVLTIELPRETPRRIVPQSSTPRRTQNGR